MDEIFQPTLPVRGATTLDDMVGAHTAISTHAPRAGSDIISIFPPTEPVHFNPRSPCGERQVRCLWNWL